MGDERADGRRGAGAGLRPRPEEVWAPSAAHLSTDALVAAVARVVRELLLPEYAEKRPGDRRPERAVQAAESWLSGGGEDARRHAAAVAKACTKARRETLGSQHRIVEAARALATSVTRTNDRASRAELFEALDRTRAHLLYRFAVAGVYGKEGEVQERIASILRSAS